MGLGIFILAVLAVLIGFGIWLDRKDKTADRQGHPVVVAGLGVRNVDDPQPPPRPKLTSKVGVHGQHTTAGPVAQPVGPYSIGSDHWPGAAKAIEEMGELLQSLGKLIALGDAGEHWDGTNLRDKLEEEIGDVKAALYWFEKMNKLSKIKTEARSTIKQHTYDGWHKDGVG
jgi:hypothetical protein